MGIAILNHPVEKFLHTQDQFSKPDLNIILDHNHLTIIGTEIDHDDRFRKIDFVMSTENTDTPNFTEETLLEQQFNDLLLSLNQEIQGDYFNSQEECNTLTDEYILSTSCKNNIFTQQTPDHKKTIYPPHLEKDFLLDSGATLNILITETWIGMEKITQSTAKSINTCSLSSK